jgi:excisionase family DNA binding protein
MDELLSTNKLSKYLDMTPVTIRRKAQSGEIPSIKIGNRLRFDKKQIDKWLLEKSNRGPVHILVVDDEPIIGQLFRDSLDKYSYRVTNTLSSLEALELVNDRHFDLIFLDLMMPEINGAELFRRIRQINRQIPVVIITGYPDSDIFKRAMDHGPFMVLMKPFKAEEILDVVQRFVEGVATIRRD